jgi:glucokinase
MILAGDVGGTKTRLAYFQTEGKHLKPVVEQIFPSQEHKDLSEIVSKFVSAHKLPTEHACFGVAGPVRNGRCKIETPNLAWVVDARQLARELRLKKVELINDLEANAHGITMLEPKDFATLNNGAPGASGNKALIAAGTGLGEAGLHWEGDHYQPFPSEGGHVDFAPRIQLEVELLLFLLKEYEHVSYERVLSGPGLYNIYRFLRDTGRGEEPAWLAEEMHGKDPSPIISKAALERKCPLCQQALDLFVSIYGAAAGNLALKLMATGGIFVGGGIAPKIIEKLRDSTFMKAFVAKGRMKSLLEAIPVSVILNDKTALLGAGYYAALRAKRG